MAAGTSAPIVAAQMSYSLLERTIEHDHRPVLNEHGIGVLAWSPLAGGFLTGKYPRDHLDEGRGRLSSFRLQPLDLEHGWDSVDVVRSVAADRGTSPAAVALAWVAAQSTVSSVLVGAGSLSDLEANLAAADPALSAEELAALMAVSDAPKPYTHWLYSE